MPFQNFNVSAFTRQVLLIVFMWLNQGWGIVFISKLFKPENITNPITSIPVLKSKTTLHKPFRDVNTLLEDIKSFNENLFLCCLLTQGCLLRPHQEIRNLKWGDFSEDMKHISLSGKRNKSGPLCSKNPFIVPRLQISIIT